VSPAVTATEPPPRAANHWADARCAKAFWSQAELPVFHRLVGETLDLAAPKPGDRWLDLGCGGGTLTRGLWQRTGGTLAEVVGLDYAAANAARYAAMDAELGAAGRIRFEHGDFSGGLARFADASFDHAVSGLSISYAEHFDAATSRWTQAAYNDLLAEVRRVLKPGGRFVFSVNVPEPSWWAVGLRSLWGGAVASRRPLKFLKNCLRMNQYGAWLKAEARAGRFHYLPAAETTAKLEAAGFKGVRHTVTYARQAFLFTATAN
jgi:ubiquinone/menaquinone biosynthesis C-methylase UbiE